MSYVRRLVLVVALVVALLLVANTAAADEPRPRYVSLDFGLGAPAGYYGLAFGQAVQRSVAIEASVGRGSTGLQLALLARYRRVVRSPDTFVTLAAGPSLSLLSKTLGGDIPSRPDRPLPDGTYYLTGVNVEVGQETRRAWGGILRVRLGMFVRIREDMTRICDGAPVGGQCNPEPVDNSFDIHASKVASWRYFPYVGIGFGYAF